MKGQEAIASPGNIIKSLVPTSLRNLVQPKAVRDWRARRRFQADRPDVHVDWPTELIDTTLGRFVSVSHHCWIYESVFGDRSYVADNAYVARATIGKFCAIGPRAFVGLPRHPSRDFVSIHPSFYMKDPNHFNDFADKDYFDSFEQTSIGNDVWIGAYALIKSGLTIGDGAIVGAGAVVTHDVDPYSIVAGVPARQVRYRFDEETRKLLQGMRWWDKSDEWLRKNYRKFHDVKDFTALCKVQAFS